MKNVAPINWFQFRKELIAWVRSHEKYEKLSYWLEYVSSSKRNGLLWKQLTTDQIEKLAFKSVDRRNDKAKDENVHSVKLQLIVRIQPSVHADKEALQQKVRELKITGVTWNQFWWNESSNSCIRAIIEDEKVSQDQVYDRIMENYKKDID